MDSKTDLETLGEGRAYVHDRCQQATVITGGDWMGLCNPFGQTGQTICASCRSAFPVKEIQWADTNENVLAYIRRVRRESPLFWRMWYWWLGPLLGAAIVAAVFYFVGPIIPMEKPLPAAAWAAIGAFFGALLVPMAITPWLVPRAVTIPFYKIR